MFFVYGIQNKLYVYIRYIYAYIIINKIIWGCICLTSEKKNEKCVNKKNISYFFFLEKVNIKVAPIVRLNSGIAYIDNYYCIKETDVYISCQSYFSIHLLYLYHDVAFFYKQGVCIGTHGYTHKHKNIYKKKFFNNAYIYSE